MQPSSAVAEQSSLLTGALTAPSLRGMAEKTSTPRRRAATSKRGTGLHESERVNNPSPPAPETPVAEGDVRQGAQLGPVTPREQKALEDATPREEFARQQGQGPVGEVQSPGHRTPGQVEAKDEGLRATQLATQATVQGLGRAIAGPAGKHPPKGVKEGQPLTRLNRDRVGMDEQIALDTPQGAGEGINT